eukprot:1032143-Rhodomonas_salina.1
MVSLLLVEAKVAFQRIRSVMSSPDKGESRFQANVNARDERSGHTALMEAASTGAQALVECLIKEGADFNLAKTSDGETALMLAARGGRHGVVATLVDESTIDLNLQNCCGETALMIASKRGYKSVVEELLSAGVHPAHRGTLLQCDFVCGGSRCVTTKHLIVKNRHITSQPS